VRSRLETRRLTLRPLRAEDGPALMELLADPAATWHPYRQPRQPADAEALLAAELARWQAGMPARWAVIHATELVGYAGFGPSPWPEHADAVDIGWRYAERWWGRGLAHEAGEAMLDELFRSRAARAALATFEPSNHRIAALLRRLGFVVTSEGTQYGHRVHVARLDAQRWRIPMTA